YANFYSVVFKEKNNIAIFPKSNLSKKIAQTSRKNGIHCANRDLCWKVSKKLRRFCICSAGD
ncbi:hypothetical protein, partial [Dickeya ananatis]